MAALGAVWLALHLWSVILLTVVCLIFATAVNPILEWLVRRGVRRALAVVILVVLILLLTGVVTAVIAPALYTQAQHLIDRLPELRRSVADVLSKHGAGDLADQVQRANPLALVKPAVAANVALGLLGGLVTAITLIALTAYILLDARRILAFVYSCVPEEYSEHAQRLLAALHDVVGGYVRGEMVTSSVITVYTFLVLEVLQIPEALALSVLAGLADVVPVVGAALAVVPPVLIALGVSVPKAVAIAVLLLAYREFENGYLVPRVYGRSLRLPGVVVFVALLVGAELMGIIGALLSLPAAAALRACIEFWRGIHSGRTPAGAAAGVSGDGAGTR